MREPRCVIISAGSFTPIEIPIEEGDYCIACDAGFMYARDLGILPDLIVGDFDSLREYGDEAVRSLMEIRESDPGNPEAQALVKKLQDFITDHYYTCTKPILSGLGQMYAAGGVMTENIDSYGGEGTAAFDSRVIRVFCAE